MRACTFVVSRIFCCSARSMLRMEVMKSAILPGWSMFTMDRRISSENRGLFSATCFISLMSARVSAFTSGVSKFSSSRYCTATLMGAVACSTRFTRKRFTVEMKMFTPPSGRLMRRTIFAAVPTSKRSSASGFSTSSVFDEDEPDEAVRGHGLLHGVRLLRRWAASGA